MEINNAEIYGTLRSRFSRSDISEFDDAVSTAHIATWEAREAGAEIRNPDAFATCVAKRYMARHVKRKTRNVYPDRDEMSTWDRVTTSSRTLVVDDDLDAVITAHDIVDAAPDKYAEVLRMHYLEGYTLDEAAKQTGISPEAMRKRHERALKWARKKLTGED